MHTQLRFARTPVLTLLIFLGSLPLFAQIDPSSAENQADTTLAYSFPVLRMNKGVFVDLGSQGIRCPLTLANVGDRDLVISSFEWQSPSDYMIATQNTFPLTLPPGTQEIIDIFYTGTNAIDSLPHNLLAVTSNSRPPIEFGIVLDVSRSMILDSGECNGNWLAKLQIAKDRTKQFLDSALLFIPEIQLQDAFSFSTYSEEITRHFPMMPATDALRNKAKAIIDTISVISTTWTGKSLHRLIDYSYWSPGKRHVIILITDAQTKRDDFFSYPPSKVVEIAEREAISIYAVSVSPNDTAMIHYLDSITIPTGGITTTADNCSRLGRALNILSEASHNSTIDWEPFPTGMTLSAPAESPRRPSSIAVTDIAPNPGRDRIEITVRTDGTARSELVFYNAQGERVGESVTDGLSAAGEHRLSVDVRSFPAGVYVAVLRTTAGERHSMKFTLVK